MAETFNIGLDFGTRNTKACVLNFNTQTHEFIRFEREESGGYYLFPSVIAYQEENDTLLYGHKADEYPGAYRYFKIASTYNSDFEWDEGRFTNKEKYNIQEYSPFTPEFLSVLMVAYSLLEIKAYLLNTYVRTARSSDEKRQLLANERPEEMYCTIQMGMPTEYLQKQNSLTKTKFQTILLLAERLQNRFSDKEELKGTPAEKLREFVAVDYKQYLNQETNQSLGAILQNYALMVYSETAAGLSFLVKNQKLKPGYYLNLDIGGGSTELSFFRVADNQQFYYFASETIPLAANDVYKALQATKQFEGKTLHDIENELQVMDPELLEEEDAETLQDAVNNFREELYKRIKYVFNDRVYYKFKKYKAFKVFKEQMCFLFGGGSLLPFFSEKTDILLSDQGQPDSITINFIYAYLDKIEKYAPDNFLPSDKSWKKDFRLLVVALGLSYLHEEDETLWSTSDYKDSKQAKLVPHPVNEDMYIYDVFAREYESRPTIKPSSSHKQGASNVLPLQLNSLVVKQFECFREEINIEVPLDTQFVFLTGENGAGKTALLQAIALAMHGDDDAESILSFISEKDKKELSIKATFYDGATGLRSNRFYWNKEDWVKVNKQQNLLGYGVNRLKILKEYEEATLHESNPVFSLYNEERGNLQTIEGWLKEKYLENEGEWSDEMRIMNKTLVSLAPGLEEIVIDGSQVRYIEEGFEARFMQLSSGSKSVIASIGDMLIRLMESSQAQEYKQHYGDISLESLTGIVLIDELDMHLHPSWQKKYPKLLAQTFPKVQFWCTTHSIVPLMDPPANSKFFTFKRNKSDIDIVPVDLDPAKLSANIVLSSPLFDVSLLSYDQKEDDFPTHKDYQQWKEDKKIDFLLKEIAKLEENKGNNDQG